MPRSSSGLGRRPLTAVARVQIPYGVQISGHVPRVKPGGASVKDPLMPRLVSGVRSFAAVSVVPGGGARCRGMRAGSLSGVLSRSCPRLLGTGRWLRATGTGALCCVPGCFLGRGGWCGVRCRPVGRESPVTGSWRTHCEWCGDLSVAHVLRGGRGPVRCAGAGWGVCSPWPRSSAVREAPYGWVGSGSFL